ncbi:MAG: Holliday junction resolvase RuvX [Chitinophagales bacterium]|jgi:putative Holliday junction resolvase|nr:Holliday junction resolvase RuvX [Chitinophagales bacterium]
MKEKGRILGIDYGGARVGLATTDDNRLIATHLAAVKTQDVLNFLVEFALQNQILGFVLGKPMHRDGNPMPIFSEIQLFSEKLKEKFPHAFVTYLDERYTSKIASAALHAQGAKKKTKKDKGLIDMISAVILLNDYLQFHDKPKNN